MVQRIREGGASKITVYRSRFLRLLNYPKPLREQLMLEFPTLDGLRTTEVATVKWEHMDLERGDLQVLDSKKHRFFTIPLDYTIARHVEEYRARILQKHGSYPSGLVFRRSPRAGRRRPGHMTAQAIEYIWRKWCNACGIPYMAPRYGRAYKAVTWIKGYCPISGRKIEAKSFDGLMDILRHTNPSSTLKYIRKISCYEDLKAEFHRGTKSPFVSECARSDKCPMAAPDCYCRMFTSKVEEVQQKVRV